MQQQHKNRGRRMWTDAECEVMKQLYDSTPTKHIAQQLNRKEASVYAKAKLMGIKKNEAFLNNAAISGRLTALAAKGFNCRFKTGNTPANKGKKQTEYMSAEAIERTANTRFKKGNKPYNTKDADGVISIRKDKSGNAYQYIRLEVGKWELLQRVIWMEKNGSIPDEMIIVFKDGNTMNCVIENLAMITRAEHL